MQSPIVKGKAYVRVCSKRCRLDTFPIIACDNYRIPRSKRYRGEAYHGYQPSK